MSAAPSPRPWAARTELSATAAVTAAFAERYDRGPDRAAGIGDDGLKLFIDCEEKAAKMLATKVAAGLGRQGFVVVGLKARQVRESAEDMAPKTMKLEARAIGERLGATF